MIRKMLASLMMFAALGLGTATVGTMGCEREGPAERAGEAIDDASRDVGDALDDAGDKIERNVDRDLD